MVIEFEFTREVCTLRLKGRFATGVDAEYLNARADELKATGYRKILADFRDVPYIDSTGVGFVVGLYSSFSKNSAGRFALANLNRRVRGVLDTTRLSTILSIFDDEQAALAALNDDTNEQASDPKLSDGFSHEERVVSGEASREASASRWRGDRFY